MSFKKHGSLRNQLLRSYRVPSGVTPDVVRSFLQSLDHPRALTVWLLYINMEHNQLAALEFDPLHYENTGDFRAAYTATKFLSKFKCLTLGYDLNKEAMKKFEKFELLCKQTNRRFKSVHTDGKYTGRIVSLHSAVIRKIELILGDFSVEEMFEQASWGPGATTCIPARDASAAKKFQCETGITRGLYNLLFPDGDWRIFEGAYPLWAAHLKTSDNFPNFQVGNKVTTVPKDAQANRVIAIEPGINLWFQKAIGKMIRRRLSRFGVDLRYQTINQQLALRGSKDLLNATVDFSSASDSISLELVRELLPPRWFSIMDTCRSRYGTLGKDHVHWEKFSSMGNGFTFELESLIFYAVALCCAEYQHVSLRNGRNVSVYGDDVVIPCSCQDTFSEIVGFYGFTINSKKSFFSSCFRESCGAHYYRGVDVKPFYLKDRLSSVQSLFRVANSIRRLAHRWGSSLICDSRFRTLFYRLVARCPKPLRVWIPETLGDGGFIGNTDESAPVVARSDPKFPLWEGFVVRHLVDKGLSFEDDGIGLLLTRLRYPSALSERNSVPIRGRTIGRFTRSVVKQWYDLGPWL